jgi:uncharacterized protein YkwD
VLAGFGEVAAASPPAQRWVQSLPQAKVLNVQNFCRDQAEVEAQRRAAAIETRNAEVAKTLPRGEAELAMISNAYRRMLGRAPLALQPKLFSAARGHGQEMGAHGYFAHFSPVAERRTPADRMRLAGYAEGAGENIARCSSARDAHESWVHSSGHHRNILHPGFTELGCGQAGDLWVQNFGGGDVRIEQGKR